MIFSMKVEAILAEIDAEIAKLTAARKALAGLGNTTLTTGALKKVKVAPAKKKRVLSAEARKRIADAQRKRWAAQRAKSK